MAELEQLYIDGATILEMLRAALKAAKQVAAPVCDPAEREKTEQIALLTILATSLNFAIIMADGVSDDEHKEISKTARAAALQGAALLGGGSKGSEALH